MKNHAGTAIVCVTADPADIWWAQGPTRAIAEAYYTAAIVQEKAKPPLYRVVVQLKVDQYEPIVPLSAAVH